MATPRWDIPAPRYEREINEIKRIYKNAVDESINAIEELSTHGRNREITNAQQNAIIAQLGSRLNEVDKQGKQWVEERITEAFADGRVETLISIDEAPTISDARAMIASTTKTALLGSTLDAMLEDTFEDLLYANNKMKRSTIKMVRDVTAEQMKTNAAQNMGSRTTQRRINEALTKKSLRERYDVEGNIAIIDKAGRNWKLETYTEMVTRTKMMEAHVEGTRTEALERDVDLAIISSHNAIDECSHFEGQIISMNGTTKGFPTYDELRRSNLIFHPNCRHKITPIRDISLLPPEVQRKFYDGQDMANQKLRDVKRK